MDPDSLFKQNGRPISKARRAAAKASVELIDKIVRRRAADGFPITLAELSKVTGVDRSRTCRICHGLGFVRDHATKTWRPGP